MISAKVHGHIDVHNITVFEGSAILQMRTLRESIQEKGVRSLVWDSMTQDIVDARTA